MKKSLIMMLTIAAITMVVLGGCVDLFAPKANNPAVVQYIYSFYTNNFTIKSNITIYDVLATKNYVTNIVNLAHYSNNGGGYWYKFSDVDLKHYWATYTISSIPGGGNMWYVMSTNDGYIGVGNGNAGPISGSIRISINFPMEIIITNYSIVRK